MLIQIIFLLLLFSLITLIAKRNKMAISFLIASLIIFIAAGNGIFKPLLVQLQNVGVNSNSINWNKRNAIILLGFGTVKLSDQSVSPTISAYGRILTAAKLYKRCQLTKQICNIIVSGGDALHTGLSEAESYQKELVALGINSNDILLDTHSMNTYQNAKYTRVILNQHHYDQVLLVTSGFHMRRSMMDFAQFGIFPTPVLADYLSMQVSWLPNLYNFYFTELTLHEYFGMAEIYFYNWLGWN